LQDYLVKKISQGGEGLVVGRNVKEPRTLHSPLTTL